MKYLVDQDVYAATLRFLAALGHDAVPVGDLGLSRAEDIQLLQIAQSQQRIMVTRDKDYGGLVFVTEAGGGVILLRMLPATVALVHAELERVLSMYTEAQLLASFVVIEPGRHRFRTITP